jgi:hypothetical protein
VKLNSTGGLDYQVPAGDCGAILPPLGDRNTRGDAKRTKKIFTESGHGSNKFSTVALKNDTLISASGPNSDLNIHDRVDGAGF